MIKPAAALIIALTFSFPENGLKSRVYDNLIIKQ